jgi:hypothetical protein
MLRPVLSSFAFAFALCGCGFTSGSLGGGARYAVSVPAPPRYVRSVSGSATSGSILCAIPLDNSLYSRALDNLHASAGSLKHYEFLDNLRDDVETQCFLFYGVRSLTVSADVYEVRAATEPPFPMDPTGK